MPRPLERIVDPESETPDRLAVLRWKGDRRLQDVGELLGRSKQWISKWLKHQAELRDEEIPLWVEQTGISRRTFLEARFESRNRFSGSNGFAGDAAA